MLHIVVGIKSLENSTVVINREVSKRNVNFLCFERDSLFLSLITNLFYIKNLT